MAWGGDVVGALFTNTCGSESPEPDPALWPCAQRIAVKNVRFRDAGWVSRGKSRDCNSC